MRTSIRIAGAVLAGLVIVAAGLAGAAQVLADRKAQRRIEVPGEAVALRSDAATLARGRYLFESRGCMDCHGANGRGHVVINDANGLYVRAPNITPRPDGTVARYTAQDWVRTIRHGVKPDGRPVLIMPSEDYNRLTDVDLGALIAYVKQLPAGDGPPAELRLPLLVKALYAAGVVKDAAERIDHALPPSQPVPEGVNVAHGAYVANMCIGCHGAGLSGGKIPGAPPAWPAAANLTPGEGSAMARYETAEKFITMLRTGKRPDGSEVSKVMPFEALRLLSDTDAAALHLYLKSVPARAAGGR